MTDPADHHTKAGWWSTYVFSVDHKVIGLQYGITGLAFLFIGFSLMAMMRWQLAYPGQPLPATLFTIGPIVMGVAALLVGGRKRPWLGLSGLVFLGLAGMIYFFLSSDTRMPGGIMLPEFYNQLGAMHGTIMIFLGVVPLGVGAFGNYLVPLQIGAPDMAFPRLNMASYWVYFVGGIIMMVSFFMPEGAAQSGWTSYPPLLVISPGQTLWLVAMLFVITSSLLGSINFIVTIIQLRAKGMGWMRLPIFVWAQLVTAFLLLLAFPALEIGALLQLLDRVAGTSFYLSSGMIVGGEVMDIAGGGNSLLWQHLFWFLAHPEVYVLILPAIGIVTEVIVNNSRKPLWGYNAMLYSMLFLGVMSFFVYAHHMYMTGMGTSVATWIQSTTLIISIPSVIFLAVLIFTLWGGSIRFNTPMLFALAWIPMFGIGGLTGLPLGLAPPDIHLHDTYYVIGHFHYVVAPGSLIALFAGIYYWFPKISGKQLGSVLGKLHFWGTLVGMNIVFGPMFIQGLAGVSRRLYDGGLQYDHAQPSLFLNEWMSWGAWIIGIFQFAFIANVYLTLRKGKDETGNVWEATTLEWAATTSPPLAHGNFTSEPEVFRGPYEYNTRANGKVREYLPQNEKI
ncbi:MAG: cbb3-type cytochrome c oxidase subunit I [Candidatus Marinimicrobia bacterium]|nr:cbb3-type cytochrome c oxidase subunit I [Candidatus Neomarinimicrobiota bacterium]